MAARKKKAAKRKAKGTRSVTTRKHHPLNQRERDQVLEQIMEGNTLHGALRQLKIPVPRYARTLSAFPKFYDEVRDARGIFGFAQEERAQKLAMYHFDEEGRMLRNAIEDPDTGQVIGWTTPNKEEVALRRTTLDHLRWSAERSSPDAFGPKVEVGQSNKGGKSWAELAKEISKDD